MRQRLKFVCWNCDREYELTLEFNGKPTLTVQCPFCDEPAVVDLDPYRDSKVEVVRGEEELLQAEALTLPAVLPTSHPPEG